MEAGLDSLWLFDHLWPLSGGKTRPVLESWTTVAWLIAMTERIRIGTLVTRSSLRNPALLAKMAATVAAVAPGRLIVAMGSGDEMSRAENEAFGIPYYAADERVEQLDAAARVLYEFLHRDRVKVEAGPVRVDELEPSPRPEVPPKIWLGGRSDDVLAAAGRYADGWNGWGGSPERFAADAQQVLAYAAERGRDLELSWGGIAVLRGSDDEARAALGERPSGDRLVGGPGSVGAELERFAEAGARHLILTPAGSSAGPDFYGLLGRVRGRFA